MSKVIHARIDELICNWSVMTGHSFKEDDLNSLVDLIGDDITKKLTDLSSSLTDVMAHYKLPPHAVKKLSDIIAGITP